MNIDSRRSRGCLDIFLFRLLRPSYSKAFRSVGISMGPNSRVRFNAKARGGVGSSHKKRKRKSLPQPQDKQSTPDEARDTNAIIVISKSADEVAEEKKERVRQEVSTHDVSRTQY